MNRSFRIAACVVSAVATTFAFAAPASAHWAPEDSYEVAQYDQPNQVCHDGLVADYAADEQSFDGYAVKFDPATEEAQHETTAPMVAFDPATDVVYGSGSAYVPWNPTRISPFDDASAGDDGYIHLLKGQLSIRFDTVHATGASVGLHTGLSTDAGTIFGHAVPVQDCYRYANVTLGRRGAGTIQVILHGSSLLGVGALTPSKFRIKFAGALFLSSEQPRSSSVRDVDGDGHSDLVLSYAATSSQTPVLLSGQTSRGGLLQGAVH